MRSLRVIMLSMLLFLIASEKETGFPPFALEDVDGRLVKSSELIGQGPTFISFWATWCKPCLKELDEIEKLYRTYKDSGFVVIAVNEDGVRTRHQLQAFIKNRGYTFNILWDKGGVLKKQAAVAELPTSFILDKNGKIVYRHTGYKAGDEKELKNKILELIEKK